MQHLRDSRSEHLYNRRYSPTTDTHPAPTAGESVAKPRDEPRRQSRFTR